MRPIPQVAIDLVSKWEGVRLKAYKCQAGVPTIGVGHTSGVKMGDTCTKAQALAWLAEDLEQSRAELYKVLKTPVIDELTDNQWAVCLSVMFNMGPTRAAKIWGRINARKFDEAGRSLTLYVYAGKEKSAGLIKRRNAELELWTTGEPGWTPKTLVGAVPEAKDEVKPLVASKTIWSGAIVSAGGAIQAAHEVQSLAAPQAANNDFIQKLVAFTAFVIVAGGIAVMVFRWLDHRSATR